MFPGNKLFLCEKSNGAEAVPQEESPHRADTKSQCESHKRVSRRGSSMIRGSALWFQIYLFWKQLDTFDSVSDTKCEMRGKNYQYDKNLEGLQATSPESKCWQYSSANVISR